MSRKSILSRIINKSFIFLGGGFLAVTVVGCSGEGEDTGYEFAPNMYHSVPYNPLKQITDENAGSWATSRDDSVAEYYSTNPNNKYTMNMRRPPEKSVARNDKGYLPYRIHPDSLQKAARVLENPLDSTEAIVEEGKVLYERFCDHCHGSKGKGFNSEDNKVGQQYGGVPSYSAGRVAEVNGGHIFHVITHGKGLMGAHGSQISIEDRWKIVRYVQVLQNQ